MATLADTGSAQVNENNPYNLALANARNVQAPIATTPTNTPAVLGPSSIAYEKAMNAPPTPGSNLKAQTQSVFNDTPTPSDSVANTPEASTPAQIAVEQQGNRDLAMADTLNPKAPKPKLPTEQQNVNAALAPDQAVLSALPAEYKSALASLAPYINSGQNTGDAALNAADKEVADVTNQSEGPVEKAIGGLAKAGTEFEKSVPYEGIIQALLGQSKYNITYNNAQPGNKADWNSTMNDIYSYLSGANASSNGLPTPAAAAATAPGTPSNTSSSAGGGNA